MIEKYCVTERSLEIEARLANAIRENPWLSVEVYARNLGVGANSVKQIYQRWARRDEKTFLWRTRKAAIDRAREENPNATTGEIAEILGVVDVIVGTTLRKFETKRQTADRLRRDRERILLRKRLAYRRKLEESEGPGASIYTRTPKNELTKMIASAKEALVANPFVPKWEIARELGATMAAVENAYTELRTEGWYRDLEREILLEEFAEENPDATISDAARYFKCQPRTIQTTRGAGLLSKYRQPTGERGYDEDGLGWNNSDVDADMEKRVCLPPEWYVCEVEKRKGMGVRLPPEEFERYLKLYERRKRLGPARIALRDDLESLESPARGS